jgi:hypothetical protein
MWTRSEGVITPPCHGGDRRFKSGRVRQEKSLPFGELFSWLNVICYHNTYGY